MFIGVRKIDSFNIINKLTNSSCHIFIKVHITTQETRTESVVHAKHVLNHQYLTVCISTSTNTDNRHGNRFGHGWLRPWLTKGLGGGLREDLRQTLTDFARDLAGINDLMRSALSVKARFRGTGVVSTQAASDLGLLGVAGRASGIAFDARIQFPGRLYESLPFEMVTEPTGDCWARMVVRMREIDASLAWLFRVLDDDTLDLSGEGAKPVTFTTTLRPDALCVSLIEGVRGPVVQVLETSAQGELLHYKVQDPSLPNWFGLAMAVRDNGISDFPICNKSFDLSYCGNDL